MNIRGDTLHLFSNNSSGDCMMSQKRIYTNNVPLHIYQRSKDLGVIFYRLEDYLIFFTVFCITAKKLGVKVLSLCLMRNHIHVLAGFDDQNTSALFVKEYSWIFAKEYNKWKKQKGQLFCHRFGRAPKRGAKQIMTCIAYIANNPVLKRQVNKVEEYIWGFIAYAKSIHPFSDKLIIRKSSYCLRKSVAMVKYLIKENKPLNYLILKQLFEHLTKTEIRQLTDYIISSYNVIDYRATTSFYGTYEKMLIAINSNSGSEYDIKEEWNTQSDSVYDTMIDITEKMGYGGASGSDFTALSKKEIKHLVKQFYYKAGASNYQISKFLHIPIEEL